jgi:hypothetical protein
MRFAILGDILTKWVVSGRPTYLIFKNIVNMGLVPKISLRFTQELAYLAL